MTQALPQVVVERLRAGFSRPRLSVDILSDRVFRVFSRGTKEAVSRHFSARGADVTFRELRQAPVPSHADIVLLLCHLRKEEPTYLTALRESGYRGVTAGWFWDNHHAEDANRRVAALVDVGFASHDCHADYLAEHTTLLRTVLACVTQWTAEEACTLWSALVPTASRRAELLGGFVRYKSSTRTACLESLMASGRYPALRFVEGDERSYFRQPSDARFREWAEHAVSLCLPFRDDLAQRFFDAWLTGQVPVVVGNVPELRSPWAAEDENRNYVRAGSCEPAEIDAAHQRALTVFSAGGVEGQRARHQLALHGHMFHHRIERILELLQKAAGTGVDAAMRQAPRNGSSASR
jgi:hypothetical protein